MTKRSPVAFVVVILLLAVMGFAAFSSEPVETSATSNGVVLPPVASGRIAAAAVASQLRTTPVPQTRAPEPVAASLVAEPTTTRRLAPTPERAAVAPPDLETTTSTLPTTAPTTAPPTTTTEAPTQAPPPTTPPPTTEPPTTTTTPPTTTTEAPTTTTEPPTTTAPPDTTTAPSPPPASVEQWRSLVEAYWPAELVDDALNVIACESNGDPSAVNPASGAAGLFQFIPSTWDSASADAGWAGADVLDPEANIAVAYWLFASTSPPWQQWSCKP